MKTKSTSKRTTKRYIERTLSVSKLIKMILEDPTGALMVSVPNFNLHLDYIVVDTRIIV